MRADAEPAAKRHVVLITHGILSQGQWFDTLKSAIEAGGFEVQGLRYPSVYLLQFWMPEWIGRWVVPWFSSRESSLQVLSQQILSYPPDRFKISIVAHSFGTWLVANILRRYPAIRVDRMVFLGCVVPDSFAWADVIPRNIAEGCILNAFGTKDPWPLLANATDLTPKAVPLAMRVRVG
jgi:pimeloyl-ACP methyl ester carboxylesterase